jgi:hypothetical protein
MRMNKLRLYGILCTSLVVVLISFSSCNKDEPKSPTLVFKTGAGYTATNITAAPGATIQVGVIADMGTDPLKLIYSEVAYDGANVDSLYTRIEVPANQQHYEHDFTITLRNQVGTERWTFNVNDKDGRLTEKEIRIVVQ